MHTRLVRQTEQAQIAALRGTALNAAGNSVVVFQPHALNVYRVTVTRSLSEELAFILRVRSNRHVLHLVMSALQNVKQRITVFRHDLCCRCGEK